jgi:hypothetical protein
VTYRYPRRTAGVAAALIVSAALASGQTIVPAAAGQASIAGYVMAGGPLEGVSVTVTPDRGGVTRQTATGSDGAYQFDELPSGVYRLDFDLLNFDIVRRNRVTVGRGGSTRIDVTLQVSTMCECIEHWPGPDPRLDLVERAGQVLTEADAPVPHARLEIGAPAKEFAYADGEGRFRVLVPTRQSWTLTVSEPGFRSATQRVSGGATTPLTFSLRHAGTASPPEMETLRRGCRCARDLFRHAGR